MFFEKTGSNMDRRSIFPTQKLYLLDRSFQRAIEHPNGDRMQKLRPWEVDV
jgi:hypothetical protein